MTLFVIVNIRQNSTGLEPMIFSPFRSFSCKNSYVSYNSSFIFICVGSSYKVKMLDIFSLPPQMFLHSTYIIEYIRGKIIYISIINNLHVYMTFIYKFKNTKHNHSL